MCLNANIEGQETVILHTEHQRPKMSESRTISEKNVISARTGVYRTIVGNLPHVLILKDKTGCPKIDAVISEKPRNNMSPPSIIGGVHSEHHDHHTFDDAPDQDDAEGGATVINNRAS